MAESETSATITVTAVGLTDVGKVREHNEDNFLVMNRSEGRPTENGEQIVCSLDSAMVLAVADGMGGAAAGEIASKMAVTRLSKDLGAAGFDGATPDQIVALIDQTLQQANTEIQQDSKSNPDRRGMGTTMTAAIVTGGRAFIAQVGDSRGYLLRKGKLVRLTRDQSLIEQLIEEGTITEEEAEKMGGRNIILQALGVEETVRPDTKPCPVLRGDVFLLCSDGLSGMIPDAEMERILLEAGDDLRAGVANLIAAANENGGRDNITVILARFDGEGLRAPMESVAADELERVGHKFVAPPPPEVPNPMKKVGAALVVLLLVAAGVLWASIRRTAELTLNIRTYWGESTPVQIELKDTTTAQVVQSLSVAKQGAVILPDVAPGSYALHATAPGHHDSETSVEVDKPGDITLDPIHMQPKAGTVVVQVHTPGANVLVRPKGSGHPSVATSDLEAKAGEKLDTPIEWGGVPAGEVHLRVSRPGFEEWTATLAVAPEQTLKVDVPALTELTGTIEVVCKQDGVRIQVMDQSDEDRAKGTTAGGEGARFPRVRVGTHQLTATKDGFKPFKTPVEVVRDAAVTVKVTLEVQPSKVTLVNDTNRSLPGVVIESQGTDGAWTIVQQGILIRDRNSGVNTAVLYLPPGRYRARYNGQTSGGETQQFDVTQGEEHQEVLTK